MNPPEIDYAVVLADMVAKRDALDAAIENMRRWLGTSQPTSTAQRGNGSEISSDTFFSLSYVPFPLDYIGVLW